MPISRDGSSTRCPRARCTRRAVAAVEFALVVPFLAIFVSGMAEVGRAIMVRQVLNDAVRKACRDAALPNRANSDIASDINDILNDNFGSGHTAVIAAANSNGQFVNSDGNTVNSATTPTITIMINGSSFDSSGQMVDVSNAVKGDKISVKVSIPFNTVSWTPAFFLNGTAVESDTLVMQRQG